MSTAITAPSLKNYASTGTKHERPIFWSAPNSAWSGKLRGYIAKSGLQVEERFAKEPRFHQEIVPLIGYFVLPVIELRDGTILQDTTEAMMYFETSGRDQISHSLVPDTPIRKATAHLINLLGSDGFHKPGMHYRWSFEEDQRFFLDTAFADWVAPQPGTTRKEQTAYFTSDYLPALGIRDDDSKHAIEQAWEECLDILNKHFSVHPYFLGGAPTIADCGFMTMVWAHLARDPVPAYLMRTRAPMVSLWAERMVKSQWIDGGFPDADPSPNVDALPDTLLPFLEYLFTKVAPETAASIGAFTGFVDRSGLRSGDYLDGDSAKPNAHPTCGEIEYDLCGTKIRRLAMVDTAFQFQTYQSALRTVPASSRAAFEDLVATHGGADFLSVTLSHKISYQGYRYRLI